MAAGIEEPTGKAIGTTTIGAGFGAAVGFGIGEAIADIVVNAFPGVGPVEESVALLINFVLVVVGTLLGGKVTPSNQVRTIFSTGPTSQVIPEPAEVDAEPGVVAAAPVEDEQAVADPTPQAVSLTDEVNAARTSGSTAI